MPKEDADSTMGAEARQRDLGLSAALVSLGFDVQRIERTADGQAYFLFMQTDELEHAISAYWANTLRVQARSYSENIKMLKSRLYGER